METGPCNKVNKNIRTPADLEVSNRENNMEEEKVSKYYLLPPRQQKFYRNFARVMSVFKIGNSVWWKMKPVHWICYMHCRSFFVLAPICLLSQFIYMYVNFSDLSFRTLGTMFSIIPATTVVVVKVFAAAIPAYKMIMHDFLDKIHLYNFLEDDYEYVKTKLIKVERYTRWITSCLLLFLLFDWLLWIIVPTYNNIKNEELIENRTVRMETCLYMWMPFDYGYSYKKWIITHALNVYLVGTGCFVMAIYDSVNFMFIFHFLSHIDILKHKIKTYFAIKLNDREAKDRIDSVIKYHSFILRTFRDMQAAFGVNVALNYIHNLIVDSLLLYQIMVGDKSNKLTYVIMMQFHMGGLILMSLALEQIRMETDDLALVLYSVPWENMSTSNQKLLIPILMRMQTPLVFKATGGLRAGVRPLLSILKSTFSYYVMLKSSIE